MNKPLVLINFFGLFLLSEQPVSACSVCFAGTDPNVIGGIKGAIIILLGVLLIVMAALIRFFVSIARRSKHS